MERRQPRHPRFLFIGGLNRSGTSVLHRLLRGHPDVTGVRNSGVPEDEGQHLQTVYPPADDFGGPGRFAFDPRAAMDEHSPLVCDESRAQLLAEWGEHFDLAKPVMVEKSPPNIVRARFLQALFPDAAFLFIVRHPAIVSLAQHKRGGVPIETLLAHWAVAHERLTQDLPALRQGLVIRYEDLVAAPADVYGRILKWAELPAYTPREPVGDHNDAYWPRWTEVQPGPVVDAAFNSVAERFGYRLSAPYVVTPEIGEDVA